MAYGSPDGEEGIEPYYTHIRGGRPPSSESLGELRERYRMIGGSPLTAITRAQARALAERLTARAIEENKKLDHRAEEILEAAANGGSAETAKPSQRQEAGLVSPGRNRRRKASQLNLYS